MQSISHWGLFDTDALTVSDYEACLADHRALVRRLDVALNGDGAAQQATLGDVVAQVEQINRATGGDGILT